MMTNLVINTMNNRYTLVTDKKSLLSSKIMTAIEYYSSATDTTDKDLTKLAKSIYTIANKDDYDYLIHRLPLIIHKSNLDNIRKKKLLQVISNIIYNEVRKSYN